MRNRSVRASGLGTKSFEGETGVEFAPRRTLGFDCTGGHHFGIVFAEEADMPATWDCPRCGEPATRSDGFSAEAKDVKPVRTHWDMLRERRSLGELEDLLAERLSLLKAGTIGPNAYERIAMRGAKRA
jgi:RNA polymerase-binding protein